MSLRRRLFLFVFVPVAVLYYGFGVFGVYQTRGQLIDDLDRDLAATSISAVTVLETLSAEQITALASPTDIDSTKATAIVDVSTGVVTMLGSPTAGAEQSPPDESLLAPAELVQNLDQPFTIESSDGEIEYRAIATRIDGGRLFVTAESLERINELTRRFLAGTLVTGLIIIGAMAAVVYIAIRNGLRPLRTFIDTTVRVAEGDLSERVEPNQNEPNFTKIAAATNHMLDQVERSYETERLGRERLNELIADAAHELRTPLTAIQGTVEMQSMGALDTDDRRRTAFRGIDENSQRMASIVEDLIVIARAENMRIGVQSQTTSIVDIEALVASELATFAAKHPGRSTDFTPTGDDHEVAVDEALFRTAIRQMLDNVAIHTPDGTPVEISLASDDDRAVLTFRDHGPGVPDAIEDRVFDRFVRGDHSRARATGGAGLGLSIVRSIIESAGGTIALTNNDDSGATFEMDVPRYRRSSASS